MSIRNWPGRFRASLSAKILGLFLIAGVLVILVIASMFSGVWKHHFRDAVRPHLAQYISYIKQDLGDPPSPLAAEKLAQNLPVEIAILGSDIEWSSTGQAIDYDELHFFGYERRHGNLVQYGEYDHDQFFLKTSIGQYDVLFFIDEVDVSKNKSGRLVFLLLPLLLILLFSYLILRWLLKPIKTLDSGVTHLASGQLDFRVNLNRTDELGLLGNQLNKMAHELQAMLEAKRQLLLAISHELRSPLTRANVTVALMRDEEAQAELKSDLEEMEQLIAQLLEAERLNTNHKVLNTEPVVVSEMVEEVIAEQFAEDSICIEVGEDLPIMELDPARIKLLIKNLLENALTYNPTDGEPVLLSIKPMSDELEIMVKDVGPGISKDKLERMTEPFWRNDESRQRQTGGYGLGLHLCLRVAEAHGGYLKIESEENVGTTIRAIIPIIS